MKRTLVATILAWREIAAQRLAKDPDDQVAQGLSKCANDLEAAISSKRSRATVAAIVFAAAMLLAEGREALAERQEAFQMMTTSTLAAPLPEFFHIPAIPLEHNPEEPSGESVVITASAISASGSNVAAHTVSNSFKPPKQG